MLRSMGIGDAAIWAQVGELVDKILRKSGDNNAGALALARVPHLRGQGRIIAAPDDGAGRCAVWCALQETAVQFECASRVSNCRPLTYPITTAHNPELGQS